MLVLIVFLACAETLKMVKQLEASLNKDKLYENQ